MSSTAIAIYIAIAIQYSLSYMQNQATGFEIESISDILFHGFKCEM